MTTLFNSTQIYICTIRNNHYRRSIGINSQHRLISAPLHALLGDAIFSFQYTDTHCPIWGSQVPFDLQRLYLKAIDTGPSGWLVRARASHAGYWELDSSPITKYDRLNWHLKTYLPKGLKGRAIRGKWACKANANIKYCVLVKSCSYMYMRIYVHIYAYLFSKTWYLNLALASQDRFLDWRLTCFGKELFVCHLIAWHSGPGGVADLVEHWSRLREIMGLNPSWVKPMTYQIDTSRFLFRCPALLG